MYINTTFRIEKEIEEAFIAWINASYVPALARISREFPPQFMRIITDDPEAGVCLAVLSRLSAHMCDMWESETHPLLLTEMHSRWGDKALYFTTLMEEVNP